MGGGGGDHPPWSAGRAPVCGVAAQAAGQVSDRVPRQHAAVAQAERDAPARGARRGPLMLYFDTSFLAPLILREPTSGKVETFLTRQPAGELAISHWTRAEFSSLIAREVRMGGLDRQAALDADAQFEAIVMESFVVLLPSANDFGLCKQYLRRYETGLRAGDALHLAVARTHRAQTIYSLDKTLLKAGKALGLPVATGIRT